MNVKHFLAVFMVINACLEASSLAIYPGDLKSAESCDDENCKLPNCRCASGEIPGNLGLDETPQFVFLTFDDAVNEQNFDFYRQILFDRTNPDGCNVSATAFIIHDYTSYPMVHQLYEHGFEIALHSITHKNDNAYWKTASVDTLKKEFGGERDLVSKFAKIDKEQFLGIRSPYLQLSGNSSFQAIKELKLKYDCSWPSRDFENPSLWPYTLDYLSPQICDIPPCPTASIPGVWVVPMVDWFDATNSACSMADSCIYIPDNSSGILHWMKYNFNRSYLKNKAPFGIYIHATWFTNQPEHIQAYTDFVDYLQTLDDVFIVGIGRALDWIQNPVPLGSQNWPKCPKVKRASCEEKACRYVRDDGSEIYMHICGDIECPPHYPSIDNPLGQ